jgi:hypothetical protein
MKPQVMEALGETRLKYGMTLVHHTSLRFQRCVVMELTYTSSVLLMAVASTVFGSSALPFPLNLLRTLEL